VAEVESKMRKSTLPVAAAMIAALSFPAHAEKYSCNFLSGTSVVKQCDIESGTAGFSCQHPYSSSLTGLCYVQKISGGSDRIQCQYGTPDANIAGLSREVEKADARIASEQSGFIAGAVTLGPPSTLLLNAAYRENTTAPLFQLLCVHNP